MSTGIAVAPLVHYLYQEFIIFVWETNIINSCLYDFYSIIKNYVYLVPVLLVQHSVGLY